MGAIDRQTQALVKLKKKIFGPGKSIKVSVAHFQPFTVLLDIKFLQILVEQCSFKYFS